MDPKIVVCTDIITQTARCIVVVSIAMCHQVSTYKIGAEVEHLVTFTN